MLSEWLSKWPEDEEPDVGAIVAAAAKRLDALWEPLAGVPDALRPIFQGG